MSPDVKDSVVQVTQVTDADTKRDAARHARWRIFWKFVTVLTVLVVFAILRTIEDEKRAYDEEHGRPVVIVNDSDADKRHDARLLKVGQVENLFNTAVAPDGNGFDQQTLSGVKETIQKIKYQNFKDEKEIIGRLKEEIITGAEYDKKYLLATEEAERKALASKLPDLSQEELSVKARLEEKYRSEKQLPEQTKTQQADFEKWILDKTELLKGAAATEHEMGEWRAGMAGTRSAGITRRQIRRGGRPREAQGPSNLKEHDLLRWLAAINSSSTNDSRMKGIQRRIVKIDKNAQEQMRAVYTRLEPQLPELLKGAQKNDSVLTFFSPRSVLDENSGIHVIYQTLWLACVMVLVFGSIFVLLMILRPLPFFARGTDTLMNHAGDLFKRSGGSAPQLAKSLAATAAALGVGAAVAVAGSNAVAPKPRAGDSGYPGGSEQNADGGRGTNGKSGLPGKGGQQGPAGEPGADIIDVHQVELKEPIVYASPIIVRGPSSMALAPGSLDRLTEAIAALKPLPGTASTLPPDWDLKIKDTISIVITERLKTLDIPDLDKRTQELAKQVAVLESWRTSLGINFTKDLSLLKDDLESTKTAVEDLRDNSFERLQNSGGRSFLTRTTQVFKGDRYLLTDQSRKALNSLMSGLPKGCPEDTVGALNGAPMKKCCDPKSADVVYCHAVQSILTKLSEMVGRPPMNESDFMKEVRSARSAKGDKVDKTIDRWKSVILKYARLAY